MDSLSYEKELARVYYKLLTSLDWQDEVLIKGLREGLNKFLSNTFPAKKHSKSHFVSLAALKKLKENDSSDLVFEHLVPKSKYIQRPCEERAKKRILTVEFIEDLLKNYWYFATVTKEEDSILTKLRMPDNWDEKDIFARYRVAEIKLIKNPFLLEFYSKD